MPKHRFFSALLVCFFSLTQQGCKKSPEATTHTDDPAKFEENIRSTPFQTPEQEQAGFTLPPGFEITLFASEPDISKPINMEFDDQGRLWVTHTTEYPMPAPPGKGHDRISILEDTDGDGKADQFTTFADSLNIPIGVTPVKDGAIAYSIPNIYRFTDRDGDGRADSKKVLLGEFGYLDTHGMVNNLVRGFDGWIHACHGYVNTSTIAGTDGDSITMVSGNTFRFRPDGSRVEHTTYGRVNPFGLAFDEWGYLYSLDCHSRPIYQLIKGAEYPGFGIKHPAIGWAPEMMSYDLGSTANSGLVYYTGEQFPEAFHTNFFSGNVVTSRVNRNSITWQGTSPTSKREEDFVISADPWFRPVDLKVGPDGSLYIADFYNRIIGHYEVDKNHPLRDRKSGRIWKVTYHGDDTPQALPPTHWSTASLDELLEGLNEPQLNIRMNIANEVVDRFGEEAVVPVTQLLEADKADSKSFIQGLWILYRLDALPDALLDKALQHTDPMVQVHGFRVLAEKKSLTPAQRILTMNALAHANPHVQRIAEEVLAGSPDMNDLAPLLTKYSETGENDSHLKYTSLLSIRKHLREPEIMQTVATQHWDEAQLGVLMKAIPDVPTEQAASFALNYIQEHPQSQDQLLTYLQYIGRYVAASQLDQAVALIQKGVSDDPEVQYNLYETMRQGVAQRGGQVTPTLQQWGVSLAGQVLESVSDQPDTWECRPIAPGSETGNPWAVIEQPGFPDFPKAHYLSSNLRGLEPMGVLYSVPFELPDTLRLLMYDDDVNNLTAKKGTSQNAIRIRLAETNQLLGEYRLHLDELAKPEDVMQKVAFDLTAFQGQPGYIEVVDSSFRASIAVGEMQPAVLAIPDRGPGEKAALQIKAAAIAAEYQVASLEPDLQKLLAGKWTDPEARAAAADALMALSASGNMARLEKAFTQPDASASMREKLALTMGQYPSGRVFSMLRKGLTDAPEKLQLTLATVLASSSQGIDGLIQAIQAGEVPAKVLEELSVKERLATNSQPRQQQQLSELTAGQTGTDDREQLIQARLASFDPAEVTVESGRSVFTQNCSMCHQIKGNGGVIGPQLDGIGNWGQKALTEKVLNPNKTISEAFRNYTITLKSGKTLAGLYRREEGQVLVFANIAGQEFSVPKRDIKEKQASQYTLMPDHFSKTIPEKDFYALLKYLLSTKG